MLEAELLGVAAAGFWQARYAFFWSASRIIRAL